MSDSPFLSTPEVARRLNVSVDRAYGLLHAGVVPAKKVGKKFIVHEVEFEEWLKKGRQIEPTTPAQAAPAQPELPAGVRLIQHNNGETEIVISIRIAQANPMPRLKVLGR